MRLPGHGRLLATGDLHDNPDHLRKIVRLARLDESPDRHVVLHEIIHSEHLVNGVDLSHRTLARVAELVVAHPGQAHVLLANHELAQMQGRSVSKGAGNSVRLFDDGLAFVFGDECELVAEAIGRFIGAMPLAVLSASGLFCAHSLPAPRAMDRFDPGILDRELAADDYGPRGPLHAMVWGRGHDQDEIDMLAGRWGVRLFCLGHDHVDNGIAMRGPKVIVLNSDHEFGTVLPVDLADVPTAEEAMGMGIRLRSLES